MPSISPRWQQGVVSRQAHRGLPPNTFEREVGREGFNGPSAQFYHRRPPTDWIGFEGDLKPQAWQLANSPAVDHLFDVPPILSSRSSTVTYWHSKKSSSHLSRNSDGDMIFFLHQGNADMFCDYGHLRIERGDYLVMPKGTMWRIETQEDCHILVIETTGQRVRIPDRGLLGHHALFDPARLDIPKLDDKFQAQEDRAYRVIVKRLGKQSYIDYSYNPLDAIGWVGDLAPVRLNVRDIMPVNSHRVHLPPSVHATFETDRLMVSTFVPRPFETDDTALKVPFFHSNEDVDEVIFYHDGEFFSRDGIQPGTMSFHPAGFTHGPQSKAQLNMFNQSNTKTNEVAVMIDAFDPYQTLQISDLASHESSKNDCGSIGKMEIQDYVGRWMRD